ncbi:YqzG/YhdC family protein [Ralstonia pickettii]|nr:YqzG/YhdC family protein [Ralstonia pickettii]
MWKLALIFILSILPIMPTSIIAADMPSLLEESPPYAKWGKVAMQRAKEKYPDTAIVDYLHIGREITDDTATEKFKLWLRGKDREFGVYINIQFKQKTDEIINITFEETDR